MQLHSHSEKSVYFFINAFQSLNSNVYVYHVLILLQEFISRASVIQQGILFKYKSFE